VDRLFERISGVVYGYGVVDYILEVVFLSGVTSPLLSVNTCQKSSICISWRHTLLATVNRAQRITPSSRTYRLSVFATVLGLRALEHRSERDLGTIQPHVSLLA
jgi:hypothetical protein